MSGRFSLLISADDTIRLRVALERDGIAIRPSTVQSLTFTARIGSTTIEKNIGSGISILDDAAGLALVRIDPVDLTGLNTVKLSCRLHLVEADGTATTVASGSLYLGTAA